MASVTLTQLWLHDAVDPSTAYAFDIVGLKVDTTKKVEVRPYANGRFRSISRPGVQSVLSATVASADRTEIDNLQSLIGQTLMVRDYTGRLFYGVYAGIDVAEIGYVDRADVGLSIVEVTYEDTV